VLHFEEQVFIKDYMKSIFLFTALFISSLTFSSETCDVIVALDKANLYASLNEKLESYDLLEQDYSFIFTYYNNTNTCYFSVEVEKNHCEIIKDHSSTKWECPL
jgi:hypothetical protein